MRNSEFNVCATVLMLIICSIFLVHEASASNLKEGYYWKSCPSAEKIVYKVVNKAIQKNPGISASLIRLFFHDCIVTGCDASILLKSNGSELQASPNLSLRGLDIIDEAKAELEYQCPGTVSCADIVAFAARDSTYISGGIWYNIPSGRLDGRVSSSSQVFQNVPPPIPIVNVILQSFTNKGMSLKDMVVLSGAHSIGVANCGTVSNRLYSFNGTTQSQDPTLGTKFASFLKKKCPKNGAVSDVVDLDVVTPYRLDNTYYKNLNKKFGVLESDQVLATSPLTSKLVTKYSNNPNLWAKDFAASMVRLGSVEVVTSKNKGEIRKKCGFVNNNFKW